MKAMVLNATVTSQSNTLLFFMNILPYTLDCPNLKTKSGSSHSEEHEGGGMDMEGLFEQAIKIKESRNSVFRRRYDFWPSFYQHSLFSREVGNCLCCIQIW